MALRSSTVTSEYLNYWAVPTWLPLWSASSKQAGSGLTPVHFIHMPHQNHPWYLLLPRLFHHVDCPVPLLPWIKERKAALWKKQTTSPRFWGFKKKKHTTTTFYFLLSMFVFFFFSLDILGCSPGMQETQVTEVSALSQAWPRVSPPLVRTTCLLFWSGSAYQCLACCEEKCRPIAKKPSDLVLVRAKCWNFHPIFI